MRPIVTASAAERVEACGASVALPQVWSSSDDAEAGRWRHRYIQRRGEGHTAKAALALVPKRYQAECAALNVEEILRGLYGTRHEVAYAVDVETGDVRELGVDIERAYDVGDHEIPLTLDLEATDLAGAQVVVDFKGPHASVTPAAENLQVGLAAYARAEITGAHEVEGRILPLRPGRPQWDRATYQRLDLDGFLDRAGSAYRNARRALRVVAEGGVPPVSPGAHCKYCPAALNCPAHTSLARELVPAMTDITERFAAMTPEQLGIAWTKLQVAKEIVEHVDESLRTLAHQTPIPLPDGRELRPVPWGTSSFDKARALAMLSEFGATEEQLASLTVKGQTMQVRPMKTGGKSRG